MDAAVDSNTASPPSSDTVAAMEVMAHPSSSSSSPAAAAIAHQPTDVTAHHPRDDDGDVAMDGTTKSDSSSNTSPTPTNDDDVEMTPHEDEPLVVVHPKHSTNDSESSSSAAPEQTEFIPASSLTIADDKTEDLKEVYIAHSMADEERNNPKPDASVLFAADQKRLGDNLDDALDKLQHSISEAILAFRKDSESSGDNFAAQEAGGGVNVNNNDGSVYLTLRDGALTAHKSLVDYGSSLDLSLASANAKDNGGDDHLNMRRREKLKKIGR